MLIFDFKIRPKNISNLHQKCKENFPQTIKVNIEDEMRDSYMDYAMSVIVGRALPAREMV